MRVELPLSTPSPVCVPFKLPICVPNWLCACCISSLFYFNTFQYLSFCQRPTFFLLPLPLFGVLCTLTSSHMCIDLLCMCECVLQSEVSSEPRVQHQAGLSPISWN